MSIVELVKEVARVAQLKTGRVVITTNEAHICKFEVFPEYRTCQIKRRSWATVSPYILDIAAALDVAIKEERLILDTCGDHGAVEGRFEKGKLKEIKLSFRQKDE